MMMMKQMKETVRAAVTSSSVEESTATSKYPPYPDAQKLRQNLALPVVDKEYSTDDNSTTDESVDFSSDEADNDKSKKNSDHPAPSCTTPPHFEIRCRDLVVTSFNLALRHIFS